MKSSVSDGSVRPNDLLALFKQTGPKTRTHIRSAEFLDNTVELIREMVYTHSMDKPDLTGTLIDIKSKQIRDSDVGFMFHLYFWFVMSFLPLFFSVSLFWVIHVMPKIELTNDLESSYNLQSSQHLFVCTLELLSAEDMETILQVTGCSAETQRPVCKSDCLSRRYRTITGHCNNRCSHGLYGMPKYIIGR